MAFVYSKSGYAFTEGFEAYRSSAYQDVGGVWTIAYGHTRGVGPGLTCIPQQADAWKHEDIGYAEAAVNDLVTLPSLNQAEFDALVDFAVNCGVAALKGSTLLRLLNAGELVGAAGEFDKWDHVSGAVCAGLLRRRQAEADRFRGPDYDS
jgi:lysozyme